MKISFFAIAILALATPALASPDKPAPTTAIAYADLDLNNPADAQTMLHRIRKAALKVCNRGETSAEAQRLFDACHSDAIQRSVMQLDAPRVTAAYNARLGARLLARNP